MSRLLLRHLGFPMTDVRFPKQVMSRRWRRCSPLHSAVSGLRPYASGAFAGSEAFVLSHEKSMQRARV